MEQTPEYVRSGFSGDRGGVRRKAVGFYWTLPVPWAGFTQLSDDIEQAAQQSRTIQYQHRVIHSYAQSEGFDLIHEKVFLELAPDRTSQHVIWPLEEVAKICRHENAVLLYVDFDKVQGRRPHRELEKWLKSADVQSVGLCEWYVPGLDFDPDLHFKEWRERQHEWTKGKAERKARALARAVPLADRMTHAAIATILNSEELRSASGRAWTAEMVRKMLADGKHDNEAS